VLGPYNRGPNFFLKSFPITNATIKAWPGKSREFSLSLLDMRRRLPDAIATLAQLRAQGHRTYVHCTAGLGRAPLTVLGYLTLVEGDTAAQAMHRILAGRPGAVPAWEAYQGCCEDLVARYRKAIEQRAYELYQQGVHGNAHEDWCQAQAEVLCSALITRTVVSESIIAS
jgi:hypothetical protein